MVDKNKRHPVFGGGRNKQKTVAWFFFNAVVKYEKIKSSIVTSDRNPKLPDTYVHEVWGVYHSTTGLFDPMDVKKATAIYGMKSSVAVRTFHEITASQAANIDAFQAHQNEVWK